MKIGQTVYPIMAGILFGMGSMKILDYVLARNSYREYFLEQQKEPLSEGLQEIIEKEALDSASNNRQLLFGLIILAGASQAFWLSYNSWKRTDEE